MEMTCKSASLVHSQASPICLFFWFVFCIHGSGITAKNGAVPLLCIILNVNETIKEGWRPENKALYINQQFYVCNTMKLQKQALKTGMSMGRKTDM